MRTAAKELVGLQPDVILSSSTAATTAFARETQTIPIVFAILSDPPGGPGRGGELRPAAQAASLAGQSHRRST
jgi:ABC-type uncharacterized transport system substrate-binding protein